MIRGAFRTAGGLLSPDPLKRIGAFERLTEYLIKRLPPEQMNKHLEIPEQLPQSSVEGAKLYAHRDEMLHVIPQDGEMAEVGTWRGGFSRKICEVLHPRLLHLIDIDFSEFDWSGVTRPHAQHSGDSSTILKSFPPASLDWIYIDGDHSYEGARKDIEAAHRVLKSGCLMTCNDYTNWASLAVTPYGVARAVNEFVVREGYRIEGLAFSRWGNHDLLIRKPQ